MYGHLWRIKKMKIIAIIPARKGSKRIPNKNFKLFCGKPLVEWTLEEAFKVDWFHEIWLNTDSVEAFSKYKSWNEKDFRFKCYLRPEELGGDKITMGEVIRDQFKRKIEEEDDMDIIVLLQPTSPLRNASHISNAIFQYIKEDPYGKMASIFQKNEKLWMLNGAIYISTINDVAYNGFEFYMNVESFYVMKEEDSIDIDTQEDWDKAQRIIKKNTFFYNQIRKKDNIIE